MSDLIKVKKQILALLKDRLNDMIPNNDTYPNYESTIMAMTEEELEYWVTALENGVLDIPDYNKPSDTICLIVPNLDKKNRLSVKRNLALAKKMGHDFFEQIWLTNPVTGQTVLTNCKYLVMDIPVRRQAQTLDHKISLAESDKNVDDMTGQVTGESKGASISYPEVQMLDAQGLYKTSYELIKIRGGDETAWRLAKQRMLTTGDFDQDELDRVDSRAKVNETLSILLKGMHIQNNLVE